jgi:hypothetical protein
MNIIDGKYKKIPLNNMIDEEFEVDYDNIGEISIRFGSKDVSKDCKVILMLSKEALIGFGINAIRQFNTFKEYHHFHIEPLGESISNQAMGFFLTPESAELVIGCKNYGSLNKSDFLRIQNIDKDKNYIDFEGSFLVDLDFDNEYFECYNLGLFNIGSLKVIYENKDISKKCTVSMTLSKNALLGFGTELLRIAHNYKEGRIYQIDEKKLSSLLGFFMTSNSATFSLECKKFHNVFYYDNEFGKRL